ncbi:MAG TPA: hypothetical protein VMT88_13545 [Actinomycetes bacterium]|nr:hypothetical protein [Actinomycetes bacterium]
MKRAWILIVVAVAVLLASSVPAQAAPPRQTTRVDNFTLTIRCDGFKLHDDVQVSVHIQRFFTSDGKRSRATVHIRWQGVITNPATGEFLTTDPGYWQDTFANHTITTRGLVVNIRIAELGIFIHDVGRTITNLRTGEVTFESSTDANHQNFDDLCDALA